jgi:hypothetical protein
VGHCAQYRAAQDPTGQAADQDRQHRELARLPGHPVFRYPEERRLRRVSKDGKTSCSLMVRDARKSALLTMTGNACQNAQRRRAEYDRSAALRMDTGPSNPQLIYVRANRKKVQPIR